MIALQDIYLSYGEKRVLQSFNLKVAAGQTLCLYGPSGCGKTTVLRLVAGLLKPSAGTVRVNGRVSMVFQENRLIPYLTVRENVLAVAEQDEALSALGLRDYADARTGDLSGGMARRAAIARAVSHGGDILLLDEPFNGLDAENKRIAAEYIRSRFQNKAILMVSHQAEDIALMQAEIVPLR